MIKYVLHPGSGVLKLGDRARKLNAAQLAAAYGVAMEECDVFRLPLEWSNADYRAEQERTQHLIRLYPTLDGRYELPEASASASADALKPLKLSAAAVTRFEDAARTCGYFLARYERASELPDATEWIAIPWRVEGEGAASPDVLVRKLVDVWGGCGVKVVRWVGCGHRRVRCRLVLVEASELGGVELAFDLSVMLPEGYDENEIRGRFSGEGENRTQPHPRHGFM